MWLFSFETEDWVTAGTFLDPALDWLWEFWERTSVLLLVEATTSELMVRKTILFVKNTHYPPQPPIDVGRVCQELKSKHFRCFCFRFELSWWSCGQMVQFQCSVRWFCAEPKRQRRLSETHIRRHCGISWNKRPGLSCILRWAILCFMVKTHHAEFRGPHWENSPISTAQETKICVSKSCELACNRNPSHGWTCLFKSGPSCPVKFWIGFAADNWKNCSGCASVENGCNVVEVQPGERVLISTTPSPGVFSLRFAVFWIDWSWPTLVNGSVYFVDLLFEWPSAFWWIPFQDAKSVLLPCQFQAFIFLCGLYSEHLHFNIIWSRVSRQLCRFDIFSTCWSVSIQSSSINALFDNLVLEITQMAIEGPTDNCQDSLKIQDGMWQAG